MKNKLKYKSKMRMVKKSCIFYFLLLFFNTSLFAQSYPPYTAVVYDTAASTGYYFITPMNILSVSGFKKCTNMILDKYGEVIYYNDWPVGIRASDFKIQNNGIMTFTDDDQFYLMDSTFEIIDTVNCKNGFLFDGHDFQILPNGNYLYLTEELVHMDLSSYPIFKIQNLPGSKNALVLSNVIQEQDTAGNVVFEWHAKDYFAFDETNQAYLFDTAFVDWTHSNAVELDYDGNILLSTRAFDEITKISRSDSSILWRLGGNKNQFTFINDSLHFRKQHDCRRLPNGNITLFDNGYGLSGPLHPVYAKEYNIDETQLTATLVWNYSYDSTIWSRSRGNVQRLANGNTIIDYGKFDTDNLLFGCVDPAGNPIIEVRFLDTLVSYRAFNYPVLPWDINRPKIACEEINSQVYLSVDSGLSSYIWNTGDTVCKILITDTGSYDVFVPRGIGGYLKSEKFKVSDMSNPCNLITNIAVDISTETFTLAPNPVKNELFIQTEGLKSKYILFDIFDVFGKKVYSAINESSHRISIDLSSLSDGFYFIRVNGIVKKFIKI